jgi:hypothetical protein
MATYTPNYDLIKPDTDDVVQISDLNENMDIVDTAIMDAANPQKFVDGEQGEIVGSAADTDGKIFAENDGTGSVTGWNALKQQVANIPPIPPAMTQAEINTGTQTATRVISPKILKDNLPFSVSATLAAATTTTVSNAKIRAGQEFIIYDNAGTDAQLAAYLAAAYTSVVSAGKVVFTKTGTTPTITIPVILQFL